MKGVALSMTDARLIDITHDITPQNIREGAFILRTSAPFFPVGTVHVAVVDPGVGTSRRGIVITTNSQILVGPDNGLLIPTARLLGDIRVYEIKNTELMLKSVSNTFHGRDVFTPIAAHIINGLLFEEIGPQITDYVNLDFGTFEITSRSATGRVIYIDSFGNIITNINTFQLNQVLDFDKKIMLFIGDKQIRIPFVKSYDFVKPKEIIATIGSHNQLEIAINRGNAGKKLGVKIDDEIKILFT
jgi:hypothetical protein